MYATLAVLGLPDAERRGAAVCRIASPSTQAFGSPSPGLVAALRVCQRRRERASGGPRRNEERSLAMATERRQDGLGSLFSMACRERTEAFARHLQSRLNVLGAESPSPGSEDGPAMTVHQTDLDPERVVPWHARASSSSDSEPYFDFDLDPDSSGSTEEEDCELVALPMAPSSVEPESGCVSSRLGTSPDSDGSDYFEVECWSESPPQKIPTCSSKSRVYTSFSPPPYLRRSPSPPFVTPDSTPNTTPSASPASYTSCNGFSLPDESEETEEASLSNELPSSTSAADRTQDEVLESHTAPVTEHDQYLPPISSLSLESQSKVEGEPSQSEDEECEEKREQEEEKEEENRDEDEKEEMNSPENEEDSKFHSKPGDESTLDSEGLLSDDGWDYPPIVEKPHFFRSTYARPSSLAVEHPNKMPRLALAGVCPLMDPKSEDDGLDSPTRTSPRLLINYEDNLGESQEHEMNTSEDEGIPRQRARRCSSLRTGKTPPGTPGRKKIVRFADVLGLDLADVRTFLDEIPKVPSSAYDDLHDVDLEPSESPPKREESPPCAPPPQQSIRTLVPLFQQPGGQPDFLKRVRQQQVCLENAALQDPSMLSVSGVVRVRNLDFNKSVHIRYSMNGWTSFSDLQATYIPHSCDGFSDKFSFVLFAHTLAVGQRLEFAVRFQCKGCQYWDSNNGANYAFQCLPASSPASYLPLSSPEERWTSFY